MIKAILFDLDGVLVDACEWHYESLNRALQAVANVSISREEHETTYNGLPTKEKLNILTEKGLLDKNLHEKVWDLKQEMTCRVIEDLAKIDRVKITLLEYLYVSKIKVACVTNSISKTANMMLERTGQMDYMEFVVSNEDIKPNKPDPAPYLHAIKRLGFSPKEVLIVEDSEKGVASAIASGAFVKEVKGPKEVTKSNIQKWITEFKEC